MMQRSPSRSTRAASERSENLLRDSMKVYRRTLQKIARIKTKVLCALRDEGVREAEDLLQVPAQDAGAVRCNVCVGCTTLSRLGPCCLCPGCLAKEACNEHSRLCFTWRQPTTTFVVGSVVTGVSSLCVIAEYDLKKYRELLDKLGDASVDIESVLDEFPLGAEQHKNDRYNASRRTRDTMMEEEQFLVIESLVNRYQDERVRLTDVESDDGTILDDAVEVGIGPGDGYGLLTHTQTYYPFSQHTPRAQDSAPEVVRGDQDLGLGLGELSGTEMQEWLARACPTTVAETQAVVTSTEENGPPTSSPMTTPASTYQPDRGEKPKSIPEKSVENAVSPPRKAVSIPMTTLVVSLTTTTITTSSTNTTPSASVSAEAVASPSSASGPARRRSSSECLEKSRAGTREDESDQLFRVRQLVATRSRSFAQNLDAVLERARNSEGRAMHWLPEEIRNCQRDMDRLEDLESTAWTLLDKLEGKSAQKKRIDKWRDWQSRQTERLRQAKSLSWDSGQPEALAPREDRHRGCQRSAGHVEKVKLPTFSGRQEDFAEFRNQFRELCAGERYTPVVEMAQLKTKLPREAMTTIAGLQCPEEAWKRLEEMYGNRELSILSAIKNLREFKTSKTAPHEQVIELAMAAQKCLTELKNIDAVEDLLGDRESIACIIMALPSSVRDKWYDVEVPEETRAKGAFLVKWLEKQRQNAIRVRLDTMAAKLRTTAAPVAKSGTASAVSTDKGLESSSLHTQASDRDAASGSATVKKPPLPKDPPSDKPTRVDVKTSQDAQVVADRRKASLETRKLDKCPVCSQQHHYERTWTSAQPPVKAKLLSTHLTSCSRFLAMSSSEKLATVLGNAACLHCASWDHATHKFQNGKPTKEPKCSVVVNGAACGGAHGRWFHDGSGDGGSHSVVAASPARGPGLYEVYSVPVRAERDESGQDGALGMVMVDPGSDTTFIRHEFAQRIGLTGDPCHFRLKVVDREARPIETSRYQMVLEDSCGVGHLVNALGLETITILPPDPDLSPLRALEGSLPDDAFNRPQGDVDILLGLRDSALHGSTERQWGNLRLLRSPLGCGWSWRGTYPDLQHSSPQMSPSLSAAAYVLQQAYQDPGEIAQLYHIQNVREFNELSELGTAPPPVCLRCKGCRDCTFRRRRLTPEEQEVVSRVESEMRIDSLTGIITASYPWKNCVRRMVDNRRQAQKVQETMEKHMVDAGTHAGYIAEMQKSISEDKVRALSQQEMEDWHGPCHYITTFAVVKPESVSTKTRVVANSAMRNARSRLSLNECMWPGPNALCDLFDCLIFWRAVEVALMTDLRKAYQAIHTGPMELHLRRFLYREARDQPWRDYAFTRATFGDVAAGLILEIAKRKVAELGSGEDPIAAQQLQDYCYVDDSILGGTHEDVQRMRGQRVDGSYTGTVPRILAYGAMQVKFMAISGSDDPWEEEQLAGKTLGVMYRLRPDEIVFQIKPGYYASKSRSSDQVRELVILGEQEVRDIATNSRVFTRRQALSMVMGVYDPLGLVSPALLRGKLLLRRLYRPGIVGGWDADLPLAEKKLWAGWFGDLLLPVEATFPRSTKPSRAVGLPRLVGFGDASAVAICILLYVVWTDSTGRHHPRILTGKCRVAPLLGSTIPRGELQAIVMLHRLIATVEAFPFQFASVSANSDSLCSIGAMYKSSSSMRPYFANRVLEVLRLREQIQEKTDDLAPISHIPGEQNPADLG